MRKDQFNLMKKQSKHKNLGIVLLVLFMVSIIILLSVIFTQKLSEKQTLKKTICNLNEAESEKILSEAVQHPTSIMRDYIFYGESLTLYEKEYRLGEDDSLKNQALQFVDLCIQTSSVFFQSEFLDEGISLKDLPVGLYQVFHQTNLEAKRLVRQEPFEEIFYTLPRNGVRKKIRLFADDTQYHKQSSSLNQVYVEVSEDNESTELDIMIDPAYSTREFGPLNYGYETENGYKVSDTFYEMALSLKAKLEEKGYRVGITRDSQEKVVNTYGEYGRVYNAMTTGSKYMIELSLNNFNTETGIGVFGSNYVSLALQQYLSKSLRSNGLPLYWEIGATRTPIYEDTILDTNNLVRESGGIGLGAGLFSEKSAQQNKFASQNRKGVHTVTLTLVNTNVESVESVLNQRFDSIVQGITQGLVNYLGE